MSESTTTLDFDNDTRYSIDATSHGTTESAKIPLYHATLRPCDVVSVETDNPQRDGYQHIDGDDHAQALIQSIAANKYLSEYRPTYHLFDEVLHAAKVKAALVYTEAYLKSRLEKATDDYEKKCANYAIDQFISDHENPETGDWIMPYAICVGGNTRWITGAIANGIRLAKGEAAIDEVPVNLIKRTLTTQEFFQLQLDENRIAIRTQTPVDNMGRARAMRGLIKALAASGEKNLPLARDAYGKLLCGLSTGDKDKVYNNWVDGSRHMVIFDHYYPELRIFDRLAMVDGADALRYTNAFVNKSATWTIMIGMMINLDNSRVNKRRQDAANKKGSGYTFVVHGTTEWNDRYTEACKRCAWDPYIEDMGLEVPLKMPPADFVNAVLTGDKKAGKQTLAQKIEALKDSDTFRLTAEHKELTPTERLLQESLNNLAANGLDGLVKLHETAAPLVDTSAKLEAVKSPLTGPQWLALINSIPVTDHERVSKYLHKQVPEPVQPTVEPAVEPSV